MRIHINFKGYVYGDLRILQRSYVHMDMAIWGNVNSLMFGAKTPCWKEEKQGHVQEDRK